MGGLLGSHGLTIDSRSKKENRGVIKKNACNWMI